MSSSDKKYRFLRMMYRSREAILKERVAMGNRICAYFYKEVLGVKSGDSIFAINIDGNDQVEDTKIDKLLTLIDRDYRTVWKVAAELCKDLKGTRKDQVLKEMKEELFSPHGLIKTFDDFTIYKSYDYSCQLENSQIKDMTTALEKIPYYTDHLSKIKGVGPVVAAAIISEIDIWKITYPSEIISYIGLDADANGKAKSTKNGSSGCFRLFLSFETGKIKENHTYGFFQNLKNHQTYYENHNIDLNNSGLDSNKKKRIYIGRIDSIPGFNNNSSTKDDENLVSDKLSKLITFQKDSRGFYELKTEDGIKTITNENTLFEIFVNGGATGIYIDDPSKYTVSVQKSITYKKSLQSKFIGMVGPGLLKANIRTNKETGEKTYTGYAKLYIDFRNGLMKRPITFNELEKLKTFKTNKKGKCKFKYNIDELKKMAGSQNYYDLPMPIRGMIEEVIHEERFNKFHSNALRRMLNQFIINEIYKPWRTIEGLPLYGGYAEEKLGIKHYKAS